MYSYKIRGQRWHHHLNQVCLYIHIYTYKMKNLLVVFEWIFMHTMGHCACVIDSCYTLWSSSYVHREPSHVTYVRPILSAFAIRYNFTSQYINNTEMVSWISLYTITCYMNINKQHHHQHPVYISIWNGTTGTLANQYQIDWCWPFYYKVLTETLRSSLSFFI